MSDQHRAGLTPEEIWAASPVAEAKIRISLNFFVLVAICVGLGAALAYAPGFAPLLSGVLTFLFIAAGWVLSVVLHESGHAFVAWRAGDTSVVGKGYLSLDPLKYTDLATTIIFPLIVLALGGIGFPGAAVYLRPDLMRSPMGRAMASLAGPAMTGAVLLLLGFGMSLAGGAPTLFQALGFLAFLQATALILNLLPVPGLDGYGVIRPFLPVAVQKQFRPFEGIAILILFAVIFVVPGATGLLFGVALTLTDLLGVPREAIAHGWAAFEFWKPGT